MAMKMKVFNVGFGECILLDKSPDAALLVDCGSKSKNRIDVNRISEHMRNSKNLSFMLTHFHADHYNGFDKLNNDVRKADKVYFPWISFSPKEGSAIGVLLKLAIHLIALYEESAIDEDVVFLLKGQIEFIQNHVKENGRARLLKQHDIFSLGNCDMEVLWPLQCGVEQYFDNKGHNLERIYDMIEHSLFPDKIAQTKFSSIQDDIIQNLNDFYSIFDEGNDEFTVTESRLTKLKELIQRQTDLISRINKMAATSRNKNKDSVKKWRKSLRKIFHHDNNACSIVFRDKKDCPSSCYKLLMTGDITKNVIEQHLYRAYFQHRQYKYMKCPHHGTYTHYSICLPDSENFIISNGKYGHYNGIADEYFLHSQISGRRYCTNNSCETLQSGRCCEEYNSQSQCGIEDFLRSKYLIYNLCIIIYLWRC